MLLSLVDFVLRRDLQESGSYSPFVSPAGTEPAAGPGQG